MLARIRSGLTYANVMATFAVFLALGGGAYAAFKLPRNSVGTKQIKKNAVTSAKVKNRSLRAIDFGSGQLPVGAQGPAGAQGANGDTGPTGPTGAAGTPATRLFLQAAYNPIADEFTVGNHSPGTTAARNDGGRYTVTFPQDISACVVTGAINGAEGTPGGAFTVASSTTVSVYTSNAGNRNDQPFTVVAFC